MPEHIRALFFIALLASGGWLIASRVLGGAFEGGWLRYVRNMWYAVTFAAFLSFSFWLYAVFAAFLLWLRRPPVNAVVALYVVLVCVVPPAGIDVPGFGLVNYFFSLNHPRLLAVVLLLPAFMHLIADKSVAPFGRMAGDKWLMAYFLLICLLPLRSSSATDTFRSMFYAFFGVFLPYYVASRSVRTERDLLRVLASLVAVGVVMGLLAIFETIRSWNLYKALVPSMGLGWGYNGYLARDGLQRASGSTGQAIALGYVMAAACGACMMVAPYMSVGRGRKVVAGVLVGGLIATLSRGPWLGAIFMVLLMVVSGRDGLKQLMIFCAGTMFLLLVVSMVPIGQKIINMLPFVGSVDPGSVIYRQRLFDNSLVVAFRNFWFGSSDYLHSPEMQELVQGEGIVDVVNSYIGVLLEYGFVGLFLFCGFFCSLVIAVYRLPVESLSAGNAAFRRGMMSVMLGLLLIISTVSGISIIPVFYWLFAGLCSAFVAMARKAIFERASGGEFVE